MSTHFLKTCKPSYFPPARLIIVVTLASSKYSRILSAEELKDCMTDLDKSTTLTISDNGEKPIEKKKEIDIIKIYKVLYTQHLSIVSNTVKST